MASASTREFPQVVVLKVDVGLPLCDSTHDFFHASCNRYKAYSRNSRRLGVFREESRCKSLFGIGLRHFFLQLCASIQKIFRFSKKSVEAPPEFSFYLPVEAASHAASPDLDRLMSVLQCSGR